MTSTHELRLFADYYQFYLQDDDSSCGDLSEAWTTEATSRMLAVVPRAVGIGTVRNVELRVLVNVLEAAPIESITPYDRVVECSLEIWSGRIVIAGCTDYFPDAQRIGVSPGSYRLRAHFAGLSTASSDGLSGNDAYRIDLWSAPFAAPIVLKPAAG